MLRSLTTSFTLMLMSGCSSAPLPAQTAQTATALAAMESAMDARERAAATMRRGRALETFAAVQMAREAVAAAKENALPDELLHACTKDVVAAEILAKKLNRPLILWVGGCSGWHSKLPECVHAQVPSYDGDATPRVLVPYGSTGRRLYWLKSDLAAGKVDAQMIRDVISGKLGAPTSAAPMMNRPALMPVSTWGYACST